MSKQDLKDQADAAGMDVDDLIQKTVLSSQTLDEAAKRLRISRYTIMYRLAAKGLRVRTQLKIERIR
jgi:hypothetical protein